MKLRCNLIGGGRYYRAGENVPDALVPPHLAVFAVSDTDSQPEQTDEPLPTAEKKLEHATRQPSSRALKR